MRSKQPIQAIAFGIAEINWAAGWVTNVIIEREVKAVFVSREPEPPDLA